MDTPMVMMLKWNVDGYSNNKLGPSRIDGILRDHAWDTSPTFVAAMVNTIASLTFVIAIALR